LVVLASIGWVGALYVRGQTSSDHLVWVMSGVLLSLLGVIALLKYRRTTDALAKVLRGLGLPRGLVEFSTALSRALRELPLRRALPRALPLIVLFQLSMIAVVWALFRSLGTDLPFTIHLAFIPVISVITLLPASVGGFGLREGAYVHFYGLAGVPPDVAFVASVLFFLMTFGVTAVVGGVWSLFGPRSW
jgi:uncharacterized protein (TIRG00374 family)